MTAAKPRLQDNTFTGCVVLPVLHPATRLAPHERAGIETISLFEVLDGMFQLPSLIQLVAVFLQLVQRLPSEHTINRLRRASLIAEVGAVGLRYRNRLIAAAMVTHADGYAERDAALLMLQQKQEGRSRRITVGSKEVVRTVRELNVTPHVATNDKGRASNLDRRTTRQPGYAASPSRRWLIKKASDGSSRPVHCARSSCAAWRKWTGCLSSVARRTT